MLTENIMYSNTQNTMPTKIKGGKSKKNNNSKQLSRDISKDDDSSIEPQLTIDERFKLADLFFSRKFIMYSHMKNSFDKFIEYDIPNFLKETDTTFYQSITKDKDIRYKFEFSNIALEPPLMSGKDKRYMFPADARDGNLTYASKLVATVKQIQEIYDIYTKQLISSKICGNPENNMPIATIPILVRSKFCSLNLKKDYDTRECDYDPGCYFIINGNEKVVISQDRMCENKPLVFLRKDSNSTMYVVQINSKSPKMNGHMQVMMINLKNSGLLTLRVPILKEFPVLILFRALGIESDEEIINTILYDKNDTDMLELLIRSLRLSVDDDGTPIKTKEDAINYLVGKISNPKQYSEVDKDIRMKQKKMHLDYLLENNFLPHITGGKTAKVYFLGYMINKLLNCSLKRTQPDDRDSYLNKRVDLVGDLMNELFRQSFRKVINECSKYFNNRFTGHDDPIVIITQIRPNTIEQGFKTALSTGTWGKNRKGVAQVLQRLTYLQAIGFFRRIDSPSNDASASKLTHPRHFHATQTGNLCPVETPEHAKVGLVKHLTTIASVTVASSSQYNIIGKLLSDKIIKLDDIHPSNLLEYTKVFLNGDWIGVTETVEKLYDELKSLKYNGGIEATTSIVYDDEMDELRVYCDGGRLYRPMIVVKNNESTLKRSQIESISLDKLHSETMVTSWDKFMQRYPGVVEYVDSEEQAYFIIAPTIEDVANMKKKMDNSSIIAKTQKDVDKINRYGQLMFVQYTHHEIDPSLLLGVIATNIPFSQHNQGPRNIFQYAQGRQAMCIYASNYRHRNDTSFMLYNPQKPMVNSRTGKYMYTDILSPGENAVVAIACYTGFNQEDSIVINQGAIDRGFFLSASFNKYVSTIQKNQTTSQDDIFMKPDASRVSGVKAGAYDKLNEKGYVPEETTVVNGDILIGKVSPIQQTTPNGKVFRDNSEMYKQHVSGVVDKVYAGIQDNEGYEMIKMKIRSERVPTIGDKCCSRHGQKGTIGIVLQTVDMPFTSKGIIPDLIINPNCVPSRMTVGQLIECLSSKVGAMNGVEYDGTSFTRIDVEDIKKELEKLGYQRDGSEYLYNGMTGEKMKAMIFIGPTYYQRLKHLVFDKVHSRSRGSKTLLLHQPTEGRARGGGMRIGEMERDCLLAHGIAKYIKEKLMDLSDVYTTYVCDKCGLFAQRKDKIDNKIYPTENDIYECVACNNKTNISKIVIPYAFKLLVQELMSMCIAPRIRTVQDKYTQ